jgi:hypothetical protein
MFPEHFPAQWNPASYKKMLQNKSARVPIARPVSTFADGALEDAAAMLQSV